MFNIFTNIYNYFCELTGTIWIPILFTGILIILATCVLVKTVTWALRKILTKDSVALPSMSIYVNIARFVCWLLGAAILFAVCFGVDISGVIAALGVGGIAISLGFKDTISNLISGVQVSTMKIMEPGDHIEVSGVTGTVKDTTWRHTTITTMGGETVIVPNSVINSHFIIQKKPFKNIRVHVIIPFESYKSILNSKTPLALIKQDVEKEFSPVKGDVSINFSSFSKQGAKGSISLEMENDIDGKTASAIKSYIVKSLLRYFPIEK